MQRGHVGESPSRTVMKQTAVRHGLHIAYEDVGYGSPAVVLVHGAFGSRSHYAAQIEHLSQRSPRFTICSRYAKRSPCWLVRS